MLFGYCESLRAIVVTGPVLTIANSSQGCPDTKIVRVMLDTIAKQMSIEMFYPAAISHSMLHTSKCDDTDGSLKLS